MGDSSFPARERPSDGRVIPMLPYRYQHFERESMQGDLKLRPSPGVGDPLPDFDMLTTDGQRVRSQDFRGRKLFITFAAVT
jgi:hypothetical protein